MTDDDKRKDPSIPSKAYEYMKPTWDKMEAVLGGTKAMRAAGTTYLPQHPEEQDQRYQERLETATFLNLTELTLDSLVGRPFSDPVLLSEDMPAVIKEYMNDVDLLGNNIDVFAREWFRETMAKGLCHVLVDFPRIEPSPDGKPRTIADDRKEGVRPYWVMIKPENLIFMHVQMINGVERIMQARIWEEYTELDGFAEITKVQIRVITPGRQEIYRPEEVSGKTVWNKADEFDFALDFVPIVTAYSHKKGVTMSDPPLSDLADLNIAHWQSGSDQRAILTVSRFPILAVSGSLDEDTKLTVGPHNWFYISDPQGKFYYVEHTGKAIKAGAEDLLQLEAQMAHYGAEFLKKQPGRQTATARALDSAEATSPLKDMTLRFMDAVDHALWMTAQWANQPTGGTVKLATDFGPERSDQNDMIALQFARKIRDISRRTFLQELKRRGLLHDEYDADKDVEKIEQEMLMGISRIDIETSEVDTNVQGAQV